ncbi:MAG: hypothetical protein GY814_09475 [Gammaproteobacteria bacterium]|nr:hypothetical protein [Gammaproteobacteria bacterium]
MSLSKTQNEKLDSLETIDSSNMEGGEFVFDGTEESDSKADERIICTYVDYDLIRVDSEDNMLLWGNWNRLASGACEDRSVNRRISRYDVRDLNFVVRCDHHSDRNEGIWRFSLAVGGS